MNRHQFEIITPRETEGFGLKNCEASLSTYSIPEGSRGIIVGVGPRLGRISHHIVGEESAGASNGQVEDERELR